MIVKIGGNVIVGGEKRCILIEWPSKRVLIWDNYRATLKLLYL